MTKFDYEIDYFMTYCSSKDLSKKTKGSYEQTLKLFARYLAENEKVYSSKFLKAQRKKKPFLKDEDFNKLLKCLDTSKYSEYRDYIIIQLIFDTGMRIGETLEIDITTDVDFQNRAINLRAETTKAKIARTVFFY